MWSKMGLEKSHPYTKSNSAPALSRLFAIPSGGAQLDRLRAIMEHIGRDSAVFHPIFANHWRSRLLSALWPVGMPKNMLGSLEPSWNRFTPSLCNNVRTALLCSDRPIDSCLRDGSTNSAPITPVPVALKKYVAQNP